MRLVSRAGANDVTDDEHEPLVRALRWLSDPRSIEPLEKQLEDRTLPIGLRERASWALVELDWGNEPLVERVRAWWASDDAVLQQHALMHMWGCFCPEIVARVAADSEHPLQARALDRMDFCFDDPVFQRIKIAALDHRDSVVRQTAAEVLLWDEPVAAEGPLHAALNDRDLRVVAAAVNTLKYYPSHGTFRALNELRQSAAPDLESEIGEAVDELRMTFSFPLTSRTSVVARHVRAWLEPIWSSLAYNEDELAIDGPVSQPPSASPTNERRGLDWVLNRLDDPDTSIQALQAMFRDTAWDAFSEHERDALGRVLSHHQDMLVRHAAARILATWCDTAGLLELLEDGTFAVRKAAMYELGRLEPDRALAGVAWSHVRAALVRGTHAVEALATYVRHADAKEAITRLCEVAGNPREDEHLRSSSVRHLAAIGAADLLISLTQCLAEQPAVTWGFHISLLNALPTPRASHHITRLAATDNLHLQEALAPHMS